MNNNNVKPIFIRDSKAVQLVSKLAQAEHRSLANAAASTIISALEARFPEDNEMEAANQMKRSGCDPGECSDGPETHSLKGH